VTEYNLVDFTEVIKCELVDACASDLSVVNAARISYDSQHPELEPGDDKLINYLLKNRHGTPFEHGFFKFRVEAPIFSFREHHRHRIGHSYNEMSGRYTELEGKFYVPSCARVQEGKPGHYVYLELPPDHPKSINMNKHCKDSYRISWWHYKAMLRDGIAKEQARIVLPVGIYTKMIWSCNPRSIMHFLGLRLGSTAMKEIKTVATEAEKALKELMPITYYHFISNERVAP
jgi:thymidylate synthase (FAD)